MKEIITVLTIVFVVCCCQSSSIKEKFELDGIAEAEKLDTISFNISGFNSGKTLGLISNGNFFYKIEFWGCTGGGEEKYVFGKYSQTENLFSLNPESIKTLDYFLDFEDPEIVEYEFDKDSIEFKTTYYLLETEKVSYMLSPEKNHDFFMDEFGTNDFKLFSEMNRKKDNYIQDILFSMDTIIYGKYKKHNLPEQYLNLIDN